MCICGSIHFHIEFVFLEVSFLSFVTNLLINLLLLATQYYRIKFGYFRWYVQQNKNMEFKVTLFLPENVLFVYRVNIFLLGMSFSSLFNIFII